MYVGALGAAGTYGKAILTAPKAAPVPQNVYSITGRPPEFSVYSPPAYTPPKIVPKAAPLPVTAFPVPVFKRRF